MSVEDRVTTALQVGLDRLDVPPGDPAAAITAGARLRRRRTASAGIAAAAALAVAVSIGIGLRGTDDSRLEPAPAPSGTWTDLPTPPLSARTGGIAVWTGQEAIFLGGEVDNHCPPNASCSQPGTNGRDGAAYDPATHSWRPIADAPVPIGAYTPHVMVGDVLVVVGQDYTWHAYDVSKDDWRPLPEPPVQPQLSASSLSAADGEVFSLGQRGAVLVLNMASDTWTTLPRSQNEPPLQAQSVQATDEGIVVIGVDATTANDGSVPSYLLADVYRDGGWDRLQRSDMVGGYVWNWTGERLVSPSPTCVDGGEADPYPSCIPEGGILDPGTGTWAELPRAPDPLSGTWSLSAAGGPWMLVGGYLYDDASGSWTRLGAPDGFGGYRDAASVVADGTVIAFGGIDWSRGYDAADLTTNRAWAWTP
jgi:hypothetical protein